MAIQLGRRLRIIINGVDVSRSVVAGSVDIRMPIDSAVTTSMSFFALPEIVGDEIRLTLGDGAPCVAGRSVSESMRAFWLAASKADQ